MFNSWVREIRWRRDRLPTPLCLGFPYGSVGKESACSVGDTGSIPGSGRSPRVGNGNSFNTGKSQGQKRLVGYSPKGHQDSDAIEHAHTQESESRSVLSDSLQAHRLYSLWNSPGQDTGVGSLSLLQGIFPTQKSNPCLPHCRQILYQQSHKGSPRILEWVAYPFSSGSSCINFLSLLKNYYYKLYVLKQCRFVILQLQRSEV